MEITSCSGVTGVLQRSMPPMIHHGLVNRALGIRGSPRAPCMPPLSMLVRDACQGMQLAAKTLLPALRG